MKVVQDIEQLIEWRNKLEINFNIIFVPSFISLSTTILALCVFDIFFTIAKPKPVPPVSFERDSSTR